MTHQLVPIALFLCVTYGFTFLVKALIDARLRLLMIRNGANEEVVRVVAASDHQQRRWSALRSGIGSCLLALGFAVIQIAGWTEITPGVVAIIAGAIGLGQLAFFALSRPSADTAISTKDNP